MHAVIVRDHGKKREEISKMVSDNHCPAKGKKRADKGKRETAGEPEGKVGIKQEKEGTKLADSLIIPDSASKKGANNSSSLSRKGGLFNGRGKEDEQPCTRCGDCGEKRKARNDVRRG